MAKTITSANSSFLLAITGLFPAPVALEKYAADDAFTTDPRVTAEVGMGVDGHQFSGFVPNPTKMKIKFSPDSGSVDLFNAWDAAQTAFRDIYTASAVITLPGNGSKYVLTNGVLVSVKGMPDAKKVLQAQEFEISWESVTKAVM